MRALLLSAALLSLTLCPLAAAGPPGPGGSATSGPEPHPYGTHSSARHTSGLHPLGSHTPGPPSSVPLSPGHAQAEGTASPYGPAIELFRLYVEALAAERTGGGFERGEVERAAARLFPSVGLQQDLTISFTGGVSAVTGLSLSLPLTDREAEVRHELALQRVLISQQEENEIRHRAVGEFVRSLRLAIHFAELARVLARYEVELDRFREAGGLEEPGEGWRGDYGAANSPTGAGYLLELAATRHELRRALAHARAQQELLAGSLALQLHEAGIDRIDAQAILTAEPGPLPLPPHPSGRVDCAPQTDDIQLAELLEGEQLLQAHARLARAEPQVTLNVTGNAGLEDNPTGSDWRAGLSVSVDLSLPQDWPVDAGASLTANGSSLTASGTLRWPGGGSTGNPTEPRATRDTSLGELAHERAKLLSVGAASDYEVARMGVELARIRLEQVYARQGAQGPDFAALHEFAQASVGQLAAQLELDLALLELAAACRSNWWVDQEWWAGQGW